jgi:hypothetical protein
MRALLKFFGFCVVAASVGALTAMLFRVIHVSAGSRSVDLSYSDFLSITLSALSLMITVLGFFVAALGVLGWTTIESKLKAHSLEYFAKQLEKDGPLRRELEQLFAESAYKGIEGLKPPTEEVPYTD